MFCIIFQPSGNNWWWYDHSAAQCVRYHPENGPDAEQTFTEDPDNPHIFAYEGISADDPRCPAAGN